jgi:hypothetical protein
MSETVCAGLQMVFFAFLKGIEGHPELILPTIQVRSHFIHCVPCVKTIFYESQYKLYYVHNCCLGSMSMDPSQGLCTFLTVARCFQGNELVPDGSAHLHSSLPGICCFCQGCVSHLVNIDAMLLIIMWHLHPLRQVLASHAIGLNGKSFVCRISW